jgi:hypothetical protein
MAPLALCADICASCTAVAGCSAELHAVRDKTATATASGHSEMQTANRGVIFGER